MHVQAEFFGSVLLQRFFPCIRVQNLIARKVQLLALFLSRRQIKINLSAKVGAFDLVLFDGLDGVFQAIPALQRHFDVPVVVPTNRLAFLCAGLYRILRGQDLRQGGEALLPVEDQELRIRGTWGEGNPFHRPYLKLGLAAGLQQHDRPNRE